MAYYLKYRLCNIEPIRIADDSISESEQTMCLRYIPGTTIRGLVISEFSSDLESFPKWKELLFSERTSFLNAYLSVDSQCLFPSPKGFYEDKRAVPEGESKQIQNVVKKGVFDEGLKRAGLGNFCQMDMDKGMISYYSTSCSSELKIKIQEEKNMFRNSYMEAGQFFYGAIKSESKELIEAIGKLFSKGQLMVGNARTQGYGKCKVEWMEIDSKDPYAGYRLQGDVTGHVYMYLLSDMVMRDDFGEYCGINLSELERILHISNLRIEFCSTSTRDVRGYNRTLGIRLPSVTMYEKGSVFKLLFDGTVTVKAMEETCDCGIGIRRNEGFGRVMFFDSKYERLTQKRAGRSSRCLPDGLQKEEEDAAVLKLIAKSYYRKRIAVAARKFVVENHRDKGGISVSKERAIEPLLVSNRFSFRSAKELVNAYYQHETEKQENKRIHKHGGNINSSMEHIRKVLDTDIQTLLGLQFEGGCIMGVPVKELLSEEEEGRIKLEIILSELRYDSKGEH